MCLIDVKAKSYVGASVPSSVVHEHGSDPFSKVCCDGGTAAGINSMAEGFHVESSPPAQPPFLQVVPVAGVVLCIAHGSCYTRRNIARHLSEQHHLQRQAKKQALASLKRQPTLPSARRRHGIRHMGRRRSRASRCWTGSAASTSAAATAASTSRQSSNTAFRRTGGGESTRLHRWRKEGGPRSPTDRPSCRRCSLRRSRRGWEYKVVWASSWLPRSELGNARRLLRKLS